MVRHAVALTAEHSVTLIAGCLTQPSTRLRPRATDDTITNELMVSPIGMATSLRLSTNRRSHCLTECISCSRY